MYKKNIPSNFSAPKNKHSKNKQIEKKYFFFKKTQAVLLCWVPLQSPSSNYDKSLRTFFNVQQLTQGLNVDRQKVDVLAIDVWSPIDV